MVERTSVVVPAFNAAASIGKLVSALRSSGAWHQIVVVDDGSLDATATEAAAAGAEVVRHPSHRGHGAAVRSGIARTTGSFVMTMDLNERPRASDAVRLAQHLDAYELVVGTRAIRAQEEGFGGSGATLLNRLASHLTEQDVPDLTSGFRAANRSCFVEFLHLVPSGFSMPAITTLAFLKAGYSVRFEPIEIEPGSVRQDERASFLRVLMNVITIYSPLRTFLPISVAAFALGAAYAVWTILGQSHVTNSSVVLILLSVVIFLVGLISEQVSSLRFGGRRR